MSSIILPRRFYSQPQGAVDPDPAWGLAGIAVPQGLSELSGSVSIGLDAHGDFGWVGGATGNRQVLVSAIPYYIGTPETTLIGYYNYHGSTSTDPALIGNATSAAGGWRMGPTTCNYRRVGSAASLPITLPSGPGPSLVVMTLDSTGGKAYVNGVLQSSDANAPQLSTATAAARLVGANTAATRAPASVLFAAWARRAFTALEVEALADNPWQLIKPRRRVLYFDVAGGGSSHNVTAANAVIASSASGAAISQAHPVTAAHASSQPSASGAVVAQSHLVAVATAVSATASSGAAIQQTQRVEAASASSQPTASGASVSQSVTHYAVIASASVQPVASGAAVSRAHHIAGASAITQHAAAGAAIAQTHLATPASAASQPIASGAAASADGTQHIGIANASSPPVASGAAIIQTHRITLPGVAIDSIASGSAIVQAHLVGASNVVSIVRTSGVNAGDGDLIGLPNLVVAVPAEQRILRVPAEKRIFRAQK